MKLAGAKPPTHRSKRKQSPGRAAERRRRAARRAHGDPAGQAPIRALGVQSKLTVGQAGDRFEREADRVADAVMRKEVADVRRQPVEEEEETLQTISLGGGPLQRTCRQCAEEVQRQADEEQEEETLQRTRAGCREPAVQRQAEEEKEQPVQSKAVPGRLASVAPGAEARIRSMRGGGRPLSASSRSFFESRLGYDFAAVRIHTGTRANETARSVGARAFTLGRNIVFGAGEYAPEAPGGKRLLAHELVHTVQQGGAGIRRLSLGTPADVREQAPSGLARQRAAEAPSNGPALASATSESSASAGRGARRVSGHYAAGDARPRGAAAIQFQAPARIQRDVPTAQQQRPCDPRILGAAITTARAWMGRVGPVVAGLVTKLESAGSPNLTRREQMAADAFRQYFDLDLNQQTQRQPVLTVARRIAGPLQNAVNAASPDRAWFRCVTLDYEDCQRNPLQGQIEAFIRCRQRPIYICADAFENRRPERSIAAVIAPSTATQRGHIIMHELAHFAGACRADEVYSRTCAPGELDVNAERRRGNAEHYACFVRVLANRLGTLAAEERTRQAMQELLAPETPGPGPTTSPPASGEPEG